MDGIILDGLLGKQYEFAPFENEMVKVEAAGPRISVGFKNNAGTPYSWWEPTYPFTQPPPTLKLPPVNGWDFSVETSSPELTRAILQKGDQRHVLTLRVTDPNATPKPVEVTWE